MRKKAAVELSLYTMFSVVMGVFLFVFFINVGYRFGDDEQRHQEYMIKDAALLLDALQAIPANSIVELHYSVRDRNVGHNRTHFSIIDPSLDEMEGFYRYRRAGLNDSRNILLERPEYLEISAFSHRAKANQEGNFDMLSCQRDPRHEVDAGNIQFMHADDENDFSRNLMETVARNVLDSSDVGRLTGRLEGDVFNVDLAMAFSPGNDARAFYAYVHHSNTLTREVACRVLNELIKVNRLDVKDVRVFSVDPRLNPVDGVMLEENMILFKLGSLGDVEQHRVTIANRITDVLRSYDEI